MISFFQFYCIFYRDVEPNMFRSMLFRYTRSVISFVYYMQTLPSLHGDISYTTFEMGVTLSPPSTLDDPPKIQNSRGRSTYLITTNIFQTPTLELENERE